MAKKQKNSSPPKKPTRNTKGQVANIPRRDLEALAMLMCTLKEMASFFGCTQETIIQRVDEYYNKTFKDWRSQYEDMAMVSLRRMTWQDAQKGCYKTRKELRQKYLDFSDKSDNIIKNPDGTNMQRTVVILPAKNARPE